MEPIISERRRTRRGHKIGHSRGAALPGTLAASCVVLIRAHRLRLCPRTPRAGMGILGHPRHLRSACGSMEPARRGFSPALTPCVVIRRRSRTRWSAPLKPPAADDAELLSSARGSPFARGAKCWIWVHHRQATDYERDRWFIFRWRTNSAKARSVGTINTAVAGSGVSIGIMAENVPAPLSWSWSVRSHVKRRPREGDVD